MVLGKKLLIRKIWNQVKIKQTTYEYFFLSSLLLPESITEAEVAAKVLDSSSVTACKSWNYGKENDD